MTRETVGVPATIAIPLGDGSEVDLMAALELVIHAFNSWPGIPSAHWDCYSTARAVGWLHAKYGTTTRAQGEGNG